MVVISDLVLNINMLNTFFFAIIFGPVIFIRLTDVAVISPL